MRQWMGMIVFVGSVIWLMPGQDGAEAWAEEAAVRRDQADTAGPDESDGTKALNRLQAELAVIAEDSGGIAGRGGLWPDHGKRDAALSESRGAKPVSTLQASTPSPTITDSLSDKHVVDEERYFKAVAQEIASLHEAIQRLQQSIETSLGPLVDGLRKENDQLRREVERLYALRREKGTAVPVVPMPGEDVLSDIRDTGGGVFPREEPLAWSMEAGPPYAVVSEWGRAPGDVGRMESGVPSLKGMVCAVPPGTDKAALMALGRWLRKEYDAYDNINIEVFEGLETARNSVEHNIAAPEHRVLTISKYRDSGRDIILLIQGDTTTVVPWKE